MYSFQRKQGSPNKKSNLTPVTPFLPLSRSKLVLGVLALTVFSLLSVLLYLRYASSLSKSKDRRVKAKLEPSTRRLLPVMRLSGDEILRKPYAERIIVSELYRYVFCPVPKAANSNWKYLLRKLEGFDDYENLSIANDPLNNGMRYLSEYSPQDIEDILYNDKSFFKFSFVRDPYYRVLSCYLDKFLKTNGSVDEYKVFLSQVYDFKYTRDKDLTKEPYPSFHQFIDEISKHDLDSVNLHWMPQTYVCGFGEIPYDFIGKFENMSYESKDVLHRLGFPNERLPTQEEIGFPSSGSRMYQRELMTRELMFKIRVLYDVDFEIFGW